MLIGGLSVAICRMMLHTDTSLLGRIDLGHSTKLSLITFKEERV
jgi:hypothetical protein